jgi:hypothetical protein
VHQDPKLTLREDVVAPFFSVRVSERMRNAAAKLARRLAD